MKLRLIFCILLIGAIGWSFSAPAVLGQGTDQTYRSDIYGFSVNYPAGWSVREQASSHTVIIASAADLQALDNNKPTLDVMFSFAFTTLRQLSINSIEDFAALLKKMSGNKDTVVEKIEIGTAAGMQYTEASPTQDLADRTAILALGNRRVVIIRGVASSGAWRSGGRERTDALFSSLAFFNPTGTDQDSVGRMFWGLDASDAPDLTDLAISSDGSQLVAADKNRGLWQVGANGVGGAWIKPEQIGAFSSVAILRGGARVVADPVNHTLWYIAADKSTAEKLVGGKVGKEMGQFGPNSPSIFALGPKALYVLDENTAGLRIQVFDSAGQFIKFYDLSRETIENPVMTVDTDGLTYVVGKNTNGIIVIDALGNIRKNRLGALALTNVTPLSLAIDAFGNIFVATAEQGILHLDHTGDLVGVIGESYDESAEPKSGQLARPVAIVLTPGGGPMYVVDAGSKYRRILAFGLDNNTALSLDAGTKSGGTITYGQTISGDITRETFMYEYTFNGKAGDVVTITMRADKFDAFLEVVRVVRGDKQRVAANDDAKVATLGAQDAQIKSLKLPADGAYIIRATRFGRETADSTGAFMVTLEQENASK